MLATPHLGGAMSRFLADRDLAILTGRDDAGELWTSPLLGWPGFLVAHDSTLTVRTAPSAGEPLYRLPEGQPVAVMALDLAIRRRIRLNGTLTREGEHELEISLHQAYGNCPRYIQQRHLRHGDVEDAGGHTVTHRYGNLRPEHIALIGRADTFILGTTHPTHGTDTSHRGGSPGFVRVEESGELWWPDYPGNNLFNSLGNIITDPTTALLFLDFTTGTALQISGRSALEWVRPGAAGDDAETGRRVHFTPVHVAVTSGLPFTALDLASSRDNPTLT
ncbi:pyridoxamine 5'-phosphate oxidase [Pseudonocardia xinjiangensis]|uniref:Pyridoxamine 5'-phosphate oxidase n=2 Tax=Pseudonocardia xinjiangensis TaxID=75289 RepID=A0ABX1RG09_9PSEU|nr:pyridoxamine 5'-phosphate oxidase [Pseudonocardia xinjiangensis]